MTDYLDIPLLAGFVLEESNVLEVVESSDRVEIRIDLLFAKDHPELKAPKSGEWAYYREGVIRFDEVTDFAWTDRSQPAKDADGTLSWDGIESLTQDGTTYRIRGDLGTIVIVANRLAVELTGPA